MFSVDEPGAVVEQVACGIQIEAENPKKTAEAILQLANMTTEERNAIGERGKEFVIRNLEWSILAESFINEMKI